MLLEIFTGLFEYKEQVSYLTERYYFLCNRFVLQSISRQAGSKSQYWKSCQLPQQASYNHVNFDLFLEVSHIYLAAQTDYQNLRGPDLCEKMWLKLHIESEHTIGRRTKTFFLMPFHGL